MRGALYHDRLPGRRRGGSRDRRHGAAGDDARRHRAWPCNPDDERYRDLVGKTVIVPLAEREVPIIADDYVDVAFGTGALKITPAPRPERLRDRAAPRPAEIDGDRLRRCA